MANALIDVSAPDAPGGEKTAVLLWRFDQFDRLGFDFPDARLLAESTADLGLARRLHGNGCTPEVAFRILI